MHETDATIIVSRLVNKAAVDTEGEMNLDSLGSLPEMNSYTDDQNYVLEKFQWLGFDPSIISLSVGKSIL